MKFAVTTDGEEPIKLSLVVSRSGHIADVEGTMPDGETFSILSFLEKGTIVLHSGLPADAGFQLTETDDHGVGRKIVIEDNSTEEGMIPANSPFSVRVRGERPMTPIERIRADTTGVLIENPTENMRNGEPMNAVVPATQFNPMEEAPDEVDAGMGDE